jgi:AAA+ superfamily predicted ATPase
MQVAPDLPMFLKTKQDENYKDRWYAFLKAGKEVRFHVSSRPQYTSDIILNNKDRIKSLMELNIMQSPLDFEVGNRCIYTRQKGLLEQDIKPDALKTPLLYSYNNLLNKNI